MAGCKRKGCRKSARYPSLFCGNHATTGVVTRRKEKAKTKQSNNTPAVKHRASFLKQFTLKNKEAIKIISQFMEGKMEEMKEEDHDLFISGARRFENCDDPVLPPLLQSIVDEAKETIKFPLKSETRIGTPKLVVAPPLNSRSTAYTRGIIHRDFVTLDVTGVYTFALFLDTVTTENGAIEIWPTSKQCPHDRRNPTRHVRQLELDSTTVVGPKGTVFVWDSRLLHRSLPNKTRGLRKTLVWQVNSESKPSFVDETGNGH